MTADFIFQIANSTALIGWLILAFGIIFNKEAWRETIAGTVIPVGLSGLYTLLIIFFWAKAQGGFDSLPNVQKLFTYQWAALAGWVHYLAFDLFVGSWITKRVIEEGLPRLLLVPLLPLTFLFGPIGYFGFFLARLTFRKVSL